MPGKKKVPVYGGFVIRYMPGQRPSKVQPDEYQRRVAPLIREASLGDPGEEYESEVLKNNGK